MECLSSLCSCMLNLVTRQDLSNVFYTKEKVDDLETAMKDLTAKGEDLGKVLDDAQRKGKLPSDQLQLEQWRKNVGEKVDKVERLLDEYRRGNCVAGSCSINCFSRYKIGRNAIRLKEQITQLTTKQPELQFTDIPPPKPVPESYKIVGSKIVSNLDIAHSYLADERVGMIGIWGMGGVGKTTLLKKINQSLLDCEGIAVGLSCRDDNSNNQYKRKVIFTTQSEGVCAQMGAHENERIKVQCLGRDESWVLFKDNVNLDIIESDEKFKKIAMQVMEKCGGLPLALKVIGKAMSNKKNVQYWESLLQNSNIPNVQGVHDSLLPILKFSYDILDTNIQECFLFASILRGSSKKDLSKYLMGLGLIGDFDNLQEAYGKAEHIFNTLEESCLLYFIDGYDDYVYFGVNVGYRVQVHDVIYEMATWIASDCGRNKNKWIVQNYDWFDTEIPSIDAENWRVANKVFIRGEAEFLTILSHQCSDLKCLMINYNSSFESIHEGFFQQMPNLTYLDLSSTGIEELPKDIKCLVNLQYLNISNTWISALPKELLSLNKLEYLICRNMWRHGKVEDGLLSKLDKLKVIDLYPCGWVEPEELKLLKKHNNIKAIGMHVVSQEVLQQLSCLPTTELQIERLDNLDFLSLDSLSCKNHGFLEQLEIRFCPQLERLEMKGNKMTRLYNLLIHNVEKLQDIIWADHISPPEFFHMLKRLYISRCNLGNFAWVLHLPCLFRLTISYCEVVETLFYVQEREIQQKPSLKQPMFPALRYLTLTSLPKLVSISNVALDFPRLSSFTVQQCVNIKKLPFKKRGINDNERAIFIHCKRQWWESLEWDDATTTPSHFEPRFFIDDTPDLEKMLEIISMLEPSL